MNLENRDLTQSQNNTDDVLNGFDVIEMIIDKPQIEKFTSILQKYKNDKTNLEQRIVENEQWYKMRHWDYIKPNKVNHIEEIKPSSAWLFNCIANKHADAMDNFPSPNVLPREEGDKEEAKILSSIIPVIMDQNEFEQTYSDCCNYKLKTGTAVYGVFWDKNKCHGRGDISIKKADILNLFWMSGITDIQLSPYFFHTELVDNDVLISQYSFLKDSLASETAVTTKYLYDDNVDRDYGRYSDDRAFDLNTFQTNYDNYYKALAQRNEATNMAENDSLNWANYNLNKQNSDRDYNLSLQKLVSDSSNNSKNGINTTVTMSPSGTDYQTSGKNQQLYNKALGIYKKYPDIALDSATMDDQLRGLSQEDRYTVKAYLQEMGIKKGRG